MLANLLQAAQSALRRVASHKLLCANIERLFEARLGAFGRLLHFSEESQSRCASLEPEAHQPILTWLLIKHSHQMFEGHAAYLSLLGHIV